MRYFSVAFVLALLLVSASSIQLRGRARGDDAAGSGSGGAEAAGPGTGGGAAPGQSSSGSDSTDAPGGASDGGSGEVQAAGGGGAFDAAVEKLGLEQKDVTQGVTKNIAAQIVEADTKNKAKEMVAMAKENSKKLIAATMEGLVKTPPKYNHQGKWILPSESPLGELVMIPESLDRGALARRAKQKKFDDILLGRDKQSGGVLLDPAMSTSNAVLYLAKISAERSDETHTTAEAALAGNCGDPLTADADCSKVEADVPFEESVRTLEDVMQDPKYSHGSIKDLKRKYNGARTAARGGPPVLQKHFTQIRDITSDLHMDIDEIGVNLRKQIQHDEHVKERESSKEKKEKKKELINKAQKEATKVLDDEEVAAMKPGN